MDTSNLKKTLWVMGTVTIAIIVGYWYLYQDLMETTATISNLSMKIDQAQKKEMFFESTQEIVKDTAADLPKIASYFIDKDSVGDFIGSIEKTARAQGLDFNVDSVTVSDIKGQSNYEYLNLAIRTIGAWSPTVNYISMLENLPYQTRVDEIMLSKDSDTKTASWIDSFNLTVIKHK